MTTLTAKYTTLKTVENHNSIARFELTDVMADYGKSLRTNSKLECLEIIDDETGEVVDFAHPIIINHNGQRYYDWYLGEMNSFWNLDGEEFDTEFDEINLTNYPMNMKRVMKM